MLFELLSLALCADHSRYRTCAQSKFCTRNRNLTNQKWTIDPTSINPKKDQLEAKIIDGTFNTSLLLIVRVLECGSTRIRVQPTAPEAFTRFDASAESTIVNQTELTYALSYSHQISKTSVTLTTVSSTITIFFAPFSISIIDSKGNQAIINPDDSAVFETQRSKEKNPDFFEPSSFGGHTDNFPNGPTSVGISASFVGEGIKISGAPSHTLPLSLSETTEDPIRLFNTDINRFEVNSPMSMYGAIPYVIAHSATKTSSIFFCNPSETWIDISYNSTAKVRFLSESGYIDIFYSSGTPKSVSNSFTRITGRPQLLPLFALGFHQCRWGYLTSNEVQSVSSRLDEALVPHDVMWLDLDYTNDRKYFTFHPSNFKDPKGLQNFLAKNRRSLVVLIDPHLKADSGYKVYDEAKSKSLLLRNPDGSDFVGNCWPGRSSWPDFLNPLTREWWESTVANWKDASSNVYLWNDMNEIAVFDSCDLTAPRDLRHINSIEEREVHNIYGHMMISASFGGLVKRDGKRPFILTRSFFAGSQKYAAAWTGDNGADWGHLANSVQMVLSNSISSMVYIGADVGGFFDSPNEELLSRWYSVGAWCYSFFRCHCHHLSAYREVYTLKGEALDVARESIEERYRMLPYWYLLARNANMTGEPIVRPIWWEFPEEVDKDDAVMLGKCLYIVPFLKEGKNDIEVQLPSGAVWYEFRNLKQLKDRKITAKYDGGRTAVFMRGGSIIPLKMRTRKSSALMFWDPFTLIVAVDEKQSAEGEIYADDGESFEFRTGGFIHSRVSFDGKVMRSQRIDGDAESGFVKTYDVLIEQIRMTGLKAVPKQIIAPNGQALRFAVEKGYLTVHRPMLPVASDWKLEFTY